jgi:hypothetical protein
MEWKDYAENCIMKSFNNWHFSPSIIRMIRMELAGNVAMCLLYLVGKVRRKETTGKTGL